MTESVFPQFVKHLHPGKKLAVFHCAMQILGTLIIAPNFHFVKFSA